MDKKLIRKRAHLLVESVLKENALEKCETIYKSKDDLEVEYCPEETGIFRGYYSPLKVFAVCGGLSRPKLTKKKGKNFTGYCYYFQGSKLLISEQYENGVLINKEVMSYKEAGEIYSIQYDLDNDIIAITQTMLEQDKSETVVITLYGYEDYSGMYEFTCEVEVSQFEDGRIVNAEIAEFSGEDEEFESETITFKYEGDRICEYIYNNSDYYPVTKHTAEWV